MMRIILSMFITAISSCSGPIPRADENEEMEVIEIVYDTVYNEYEYEITVGYGSNQQDNRGN